MVSLAAACRTVGPPTALPRIPGLAECPDLKTLEYLDLARNGLTQDGVRALRRTKIKFQADNQLTSAELGEQEYLRDGDFE